VNERARLWGLRLLALGIALGLWLTVSVVKRTTQRQKVIEASVSYTPPEEMMILNPVQAVSVTLRGPENLIATLNPLQVDVQVDLPGAPPGPVTTNLTPDHVVRPQGLAVVAITPSQLTLQLDRQVSARLPVVPRFVGEPSAGATLGELRVTPDHVQVVGPQSLLRGVTQLDTSPIDLDGHALDFDELVDVVSPDPAIQVLQPARVTVRVSLHLGQPPEAAAGGPAAEEPSG
jgi:YbbR domain-containing protein